MNEREREGGGFSSWLAGKGWGYKKQILIYLLAIGIDLALYCYQSRYFPT